ncbi:MAG: TonB-dependent receptor [Asticcacaulis sp.]
MTCKSKTGEARSMRLTALTTASSLTLCLLLATPTWSQEAPPSAPEKTKAEEPVQEVIVTGYRKSLQNAQGLKRQSETFVDVITAEDIGALPDRSVAEALQRVPGINISRFEQRNDPDRFSVEGSGVIIRGLPFVRSELNGRDIFSANGGRELSFNDVSSELLGRVEVFKNTTADMVDGGISGTVNLVTRKPFDRKGLKIAGTIESNYGDMAKKWSPGFSLLASNTFDTELGTFGLQLAYAQSELVTKTDASQVTDPCYRAPSLDAACIRVRPVGSGGFSGSAGFNAATFPPAGAVFVPKGAGVRTTDLTRDRDALSFVGQWKSNDGRALLTLEYLKAETAATLNEYAILALVNDDALFPTIAPGTKPTFNGNQFVSGTLTQVQPFTGGRGIPTEMLRFQREDTAMTEDVSLHFKYDPTDRLRFNAELQHIKSDRTEDGFIAAMQTYSDVFIDNSGKTPQVQFLQPGQSTSPAGYFNDPSKSLYWFLIDNQVKNEGSMTSARLDGEYDVSEGFIKKARFGARWSDRSRITRSANFSNWGNLGAPWTGRGGNWNCGDFQAFGCGGAYVKDFPNSAQLRNPFGDNFQRGNVPVPLGDGSAFFFGSDNMVADYLSGAIRTQANAITASTLTPNAWFPISARTNALPGGPWTEGEISDVEEQTQALYGRIDFGHEFDGGINLSGNFGLRYVKTIVQSAGKIAFPVGTFFDAAPNGNGDGKVTVAELQSSCASVQPGQVAPGYCGLSAARLAEFAKVFTGEVIDDSADIEFSNWLPSLNAKLDFGNGMLVRAAVSKGISRPDLSAFATGGGIGDNTGNLRAGGTLESGPLFAVGTGNRLLRPVESWNYDLSFEWYFARVGSVSVAAFMKDIDGIVNYGATTRTFTSPSGVSTTVLVNGPVNSDKGTLKGVEISYQQVYDFLPGLFSGLGSQMTYTYVDAGKFSNATLGAEQSPFAGGMPLAGVSEHTVNAVAFYEKGPFAARLAYNWRSEFLQTPRDVIFPFSPIYGESTGQLDGSMFYTVNDRLKLGLQGVNLLDEVTRTTQVIDFNGTRSTRSAFRNDRRFTVMARFEF